MEKIKAIIFFVALSTVAQAVCVVVPDEALFASRKSTEQEFEGSTVGAGGEDVKVPDGAGLRFSPRKTGSVGRVTFGWSDGKLVSMGMRVSGQWNGMLANTFPDSVLRAGDFYQYVRPLLKHFHSDVEMIKAGRDLVAGWDALPKASEHIYKFDVLACG